MSTMPRVDPGLVADGLTMEFSPKRPPDAVLLGCIVGALTFLFGVVKLTNSVNFLEMRLVGHRVGGRNATRSRWPIMLRLVTSLSFVTSCYMCVLLVMEEAGMLSQADQPPGWLGSFHTSRTVALSHGCRWSPWLRWFRFFLYVTSPPLRPYPFVFSRPPRVGGAAAVHASLQEACALRVAGVHVRRRVARLCWRSCCWRRGGVAPCSAPKLCGWRS